MEKYYSIHNIVNFKIVNNANLLSRLLPFWDIELRDFENDREAKLDFTVSLGKFNPQKSDCYVLDDKFHIRENYLYCSDSYKYAKWKLKISGFEKGDMEVYVSANPFGWILIPELIINPLIWFKLNQKGFAIVHGSGVTKDGRAYVFAGQGAAGKTTIALNLVARGFKLIGDHFVILSNEAVLSFFSPLHLLDFNLTPFVRRRMKTKQKIPFKFNQLLRKMTGKEIATKISPKTLLPSLIEDKAKLHSIFLLLPREKFEARKVSKEEFTAHMIPNQKLEFLPFIKYMMEYSYLFPQSVMSTYWARYEENLRQALDAAEALYRVEVPLRYDNETLERIVEIVSKC